MNLGKVAVLMGGTSQERNVSLNSGQAVLQALLRQGIDAISFDPKLRPIEDLKKEGVKRAFIVLHGGYGENGTIQAALDMLGIPYTGCRPEACVLGMNKYLSKIMWQAAQLPVPRFALLNEHSDFQAIEQQLGLPLFVKPSTEGSSLGVHHIRTSGSLKEIYHTLSTDYSQILVEEALTGGEYTVGIVGKHILPSIRIVPARDFYDYQAKYERDDTLYQCPSDLNAEEERTIAQLAQKAFDALGCQGWARVDFLRDEEGQFYLLEINTAPGMTDHSLVPKAAQNMGMSFDELCVEILRYEY